MNGKKKLNVIKQSGNKRLAGKAMNVNSKNIYHQSKMDKKDLKVKKLIEDTFIPHPAYGHRRLAIELMMNKKKILRVMKKYDLHLPRLWYSRKFTTRPSILYQDEFKNLDN